MAFNTHFGVDMETQQLEAIRNLENLALSTGHSASEVLRVWTTLSTAIKPYKLMAHLAEPVQPIMLEILASLGRHRSEFARLKTGPWHLSLEQLMASFGCPSLTSIDLLSQLTTLAARVPATTTWEQVWAALQAAQKLRQGGGQTHRRGTSIYKAWTPADVAAAQVVLLGPLAAQSRPTPEPTESSASPVQSGVENLPEHVTTRKRRWARTSVASIELARRAPELVQVDAHVPAKRPRMRTDATPNPSDVHTPTQRPRGPTDNTPIPSSPITSPREAKDHRATIPIKASWGWPDYGEVPLESDDDDDDALDLLPADNDDDDDDDGHIQRATDGGVQDQDGAEDAVPGNVQPQARQRQIIDHLVEPLCQDDDASIVSQVAAEEEACRQSVERLKKEDMSGQLSHNDFTRVFDCILPAKFRCFEVPNLDGSTDWAAWAERLLRRSIDKDMTYFSVVHVTRQKHWILFETVPATRLVTMYDSMDQAPRDIIHAARCVVTRMGFNWKLDGWRYRAAAAPQQRDTSSCGIHVVACAIYRIADEILPRSIDVPLWRYVLSDLLVQRRAPFNVSAHLAGLVSHQASPSKCDNTNLATLGQAWIDDHVESLSILFSHLESSLEQQQTALENTLKQATSMFHSLEIITPTLLDLSKGTGPGESLHEAHLPYMQELEKKRQQMTQYAMDNKKLAVKIGGVSRVVSTIAAVQEKASEITRNSIQKARETANNTLRMLDALEAESKCRRSRSTT